MDRDLVGCSGSCFCYYGGFNEEVLLERSFRSSVCNDGFRSGNDLPVGDFADWTFRADEDRGCSGDGTDGLAVVGGAIMNCGR